MSNPNPWRQSTRTEIQEYYNSEFQQYLAQLPDWITPNAPKQYALAFRERYPAIHPKRDPPDKDFIRRDTRQSVNNSYIHDWDEIVDFVQHPAANDPMRLTLGSMGLADPADVSQIEPTPSAVYYGLDNWERYWVLAFDIDAKDVAKESIATSDQTFEDVTDEQVERSGIINQPPEPHFLPPQDATGTSEGNGSVAQYKYRYEDIERSLEYAFELKEWLADTVGFPEVKVYYSGQGAHIYALEDDPYYKFTYQTRRFLTTYIHERLQIPVDDAVTWDDQRVMRLPGSLHTDVSRVVTEIQTPKFDFRNEAIPEFLTENTTSGDH